MGEDAANAERDRELLLSVGARIRERREARGLSQLAFANLAGMRKQYVYRVEKGLQNLNLLTLARIAAALDLTLAELLLGIGEQSGS